MVYSCLNSIVVFGFQINNVCVGYDVTTLSENLDWIAVMTYDYHGQWDKITGHVAPMYPHPDDIDVTFNAVSHHAIYSEAICHHTMLHPPVADAGCGK